MTELEMVILTMDDFLGILHSLESIWNSSMVDLFFFWEEEEEVFGFRLLFFAIVRTFIQLYVMTALMVSKLKCGLVQLIDEL